MFISFNVKVTWAPSKGKLDVFMLVKYVKYVAPEGGKQLWAFPGLPWKICCSAPMLSVAIMIFEGGESVSLWTSSWIIFCSHLKCFHFGVIGLYVFSQWPLLCGDFHTIPLCYDSISCSVCLLVL